MFVNLLSDPKIWVKTEEFLDCVPIASTLLNSVEIASKFFCPSHLGLASAKKNRLAKHISNKSYLHCLIGLVPIFGNLLIFIYRMTKEPTPLEKTKAGAKAGIAKKMVRLAKHYLKSNKTDKALQWYKAAAEKNSIPAIRTLAKIHDSGVFNDKTFDVNRSAAKNLFLSIPDDSFAQHKLGTYQFESGCYANAIKHFFNSVKTKPLKKSIPAIDYLLETLNNPKLQDIHHHTLHVLKEVLSICRDENVPSDAILETLEKHVKIAKYSNVQKVLYKQIGTIYQLKDMSERLFGDISKALNFGYKSCDNFLNAIKLGCYDSLNELFLENNSLDNYTILAGTEAVAKHYIQNKRGYILDQLRSLDSDNCLIVYDILSKITKDNSIAIEQFYAFVDIGNEQFILWYAKYLLDGSLTLIKPDFYKALDVYSILVTDYNNISAFTTLVDLANVTNDEDREYILKVLDPTIFKHAPCFQAIANEALKGCKIALGHLHTLDLLGYEDAAVIFDTYCSGAVEKLHTQFSWIKTKAT